MLAWIGLILPTVISPTLISSTKDLLCKLFCTIVSVKIHYISYTRPLYVDRGLPVCIKLMP